MRRKKEIPKGTKIRRINLSRKTCPCPRCDTISNRHSVSDRILKEVGMSGPTVLKIIFSKHYCSNCRKYFSLPMNHLASPGARCTNRVVRTAVKYVVEDALTLEKASRKMKEKFFVDIPVTTLHDWVVDYVDSTERV